MDLIDKNRKASVNDIPLKEDYVSLTMLKQVQTIESNRINNEK